MKDIVKKLEFREKFIFFVSKYSMLSNSYVNCAYISSCIDPLHTLGEIVFRSFEHIKRINYVKFNQSSYDYILDNRIPIVYFADKYNIGEYI